MIARLSGTLVDVKEDRVLVECNGLGYEVLIPAASHGTLLGMRDQPVTLYTLQYLEGGMNAPNPVPRLAGFLSEVEREFAQRFITVKGLGMKAVLKALTVPVDVIARAVERKDVKTLSSLPGIGKRSSEQIIAELNGKVGKYALLRTDAQAATPAPAQEELADEVHEVLVTQLGYTDAEAEQMCARVLGNGAFETAEQALQEIFRQQSGAAA